jgi:hypothetical protein
MSESVRFIFEVNMINENFHVVRSNTGITHPYYTVLNRNHIYITSGIISLNLQFQNILSKFFFKLLTHCLY